MKDKEGFLVATDSGRIMIERVGKAKPRTTTGKSFIRNLFYAWQKLNSIKKRKGLSNATVGLLFYEILYELFDPKHRNIFLEMLEKKVHTIPIEEIEIAEIPDTAPESFTEDFEDLQ